MICYILEPETNDNLVTWGYLDDFLRVTVGLEKEQARQKEQMQRYLENMKEEQRKRFLKRFELRMKRLINQKIPIYRLMEKTGLTGVLVQPYNEYQKKMYIRY